MTPYWITELPKTYMERVILPVSIEHHVEESAQAEKILGLDEAGKRCFYYHAFTLTDERFDIDEMPVQVEMYREKVIAWRLRNGMWLRLKTFVEQLDRCNKRVTTLPPELIRAL